MDLGFRASTFFWGMTAIYIALGLGTLAYIGFTESTSAALGSVWVVLLFLCELAGAALICEALEKRAGLKR